MERPKRQKARGRTRVLNGEICIFTLLPPKIELRSSTIFVDEDAFLMLEEELADALAASGAGLLWN